MAGNDRYRRYIEAAAVLGQISRARAEEIAKELMSGGDASREHAQQWIDDLIERSRKVTEDLIDVVRAEVTTQLAALGLDPDDLARHAADLLRRSAKAGRRVVRDMAPEAAAPAKKKAAPAKKKAAPAKKKAAPVKKAAAPNKTAR